TRVGKEAISSAYPFLSIIFRQQSFRTSKHHGDISLDKFCHGLYLPIHYWPPPHRSTPDFRFPHRSQPNQERSSKHTQLLARRSWIRGRKIDKYTPGRISAQRRLQSHRM